MTNKDAEFKERLLATFKVEAGEHLKGICSGLLRLEKNEDTSEERAELIETIFRMAHSLKGAARAVNLMKIESLCQALEGVFAALKKAEITTSAELFDLLQEVLDFLGLVLSDAGAQGTHEDKRRQRQLISRLEEAEKGGMGATSKGAKSEEEQVEEVTPIPPLSGSPVQKVPALSDTLRVSSTKLISVLLQSEEMLCAKQASSQHVLDMRAAGAAFDVWKKQWARARPFVQELKPARSPGEAPSRRDKQRSLARMLDFLDWNSNFLSSLEARFAAEKKSAERDGRALSGMVNNLLDEMKKVLMFPFASLLEILPKIVRDLSRESGKKIELSISGEEIEIDRRILEEMKDPLVHMVRNCIDHGIENPAQRKAKGKPQIGKIRVAVSPRDDKVELVIADDGGGIHLDGVRSALLKLGALPGEKLSELDDQELVPYVFQSGISTSSIITEISGRGLGLAIVKEKVEKLGGTVSIETAPDSGTTFRIVLPLTVATFRGLLVRLGDRLFVLPVMHVARVLRVTPEEIQTVENREIIILDGEPVSLARLSAVLELPSSPAASAGTDFLPMVLLAASDTRIAFEVDEVVGEQEVLLKGLGHQLSRVRNVAGATVLGNGRVAPILNVTDLMKSAVKIAELSVQRGGHAETDESAGQLRSVLVVEDSITTRTLLKNILENAGYDVATAVDGVDAFTKLKSAEFDIVVSDVEMPRMNGFDLTAKIRAGKEFGDLPVVLVTALASREDRERGVDVGANAYIVKSSFDQSNLLEVMGKLV